MAALIAFLFLAVAVRQDQAPLRNACSADGETLAKLPVGAEVTIQFAFSGDSFPCYKISATLEGKLLSGYIASSALTGLDAFEQGLRDAPQVEPRQVMNAVRPVLAGSAKQSTLAETAIALLDSGQPVKALDLIEPAARSTKDPSLLALAGEAAWRADDSGKALEYWRSSLDIQPNASLEGLYKRVEKENLNDKSLGRLYGIRVALRYEVGAVSIETARAMLAALDQEFGRVSAELGCSATERIQAIAQSPEAYRKTTDAAEWSGGQYDGRIRVPVAPGATVDAAVRRTLAHEITHACLSLAGAWPAWLQEGLAQKLSGDQVSPKLHADIAEMTAEHKLPKLENLGQNWSRLDTAHALAAYGLSLEAVNLFYQSYGAEGVRNLLHSPERLPTVVADLDKRLGL